MDLRNSQLFQVFLSNKSLTDYKLYAIGNNKIDIMFSHWDKIKLAKKEQKCSNAEKRVNVVKDNFAVLIVELSQWMLSIKIIKMINSTKLHFCILKEILNAHSFVSIDLN